MMEQPKSPLKAIKAKCMDCVGQQRDEVKLCPSTDCPLHPFRLGKNPFRVKREMTEEQRRQAAERLSRNRKNS